MFRKSKKCRQEIQNIQHYRQENKQNRYNITSQLSIGTGTQQMKAFVDYTSQCHGVVKILRTDRYLRLRAAHTGAYAPG